MARHPLAETWDGMHNRCYKKNSISYRYYGQRGITVCERWHVFKNFVQDMGDRPDGHTLDRIDSSGNYEPSNCRWATIAEQNLNKRSTRVLTFNGKSMHIAAWAKSLGMRPSVLHHRIDKLNLPLSLALTLPPGKASTVAAIKQMTAKVIA